LAGDSTHRALQGALPLRLVLCVLIDQLEFVDSPWRGRSDVFVLGQLGLAPDATIRWILGVGLVRSNDDGAFPIAMGMIGIGLRAGRVQAVAR